MLVLDEPTNDLDIETLELLEEMLQNYAGTLFLVSHDRAFLDNVVTQVIASSGDGNWLENAGGYDDWVAYCALRQRDANALLRRKREPGSNGRTEHTGSTDPNRVDGRNRPAKLGFREQRELEALPGNIAGLETEQAELTRRIEDPALHAGDTAEAQRVASRLAAIDNELTALLERWEDLESRKA